MPSSTSPYLLRDEYIDNRNNQDKLLNDEFHSIRDSINSVKHELKEFKDDVKEFKDDVKEFKDDVKEFKDDVKAQFARVDDRFIGVDQQFAHMRQDLNEVKAETLRIVAYMRNSTLRNPTHSIRPLVAFRPGQGIIHPRSDLFPQHPDEFYSLRNPTSYLQRRKLAYLADFYDIPHGLRPQSDSDSADEDDIIIEHPEVTVDLLEAILGLNEDNINDFRQKLEDYAKRPRPPPIKRSQLALPDNAPSTRRQKVEFRPISKGVETEKSDSLDHTRIEWRISPLPKPIPSAGLGQETLGTQKDEGKPSDTGTSTNLNTSRGPSEEHEE